ncbi:MAG: hypothetical protein NT165_01705 [Candidatus Falkowbacteria bacterium]|nr:hypothetical protein [Candidatus Falkowbacteria bacterium]
MRSDLQAENLAEAILMTFAFFDTFNYPLTLFEVWRLCSLRADFGDIERAVVEEFLFSRLEQKNGFYFLRGRENLVEERRAFSIISEQKMRRAKRAVRLWHFIPGLKGVALCNNFYYRATSDIDLFIITAKGSLWLTRFFSVSIAHLAGFRIYKNKVANQLCLSFFVSDDSLDLASLMLPDSDPYFIYWFAFLDPIFDDGVFRNLWQENQKILQKLPNYSCPSAAPFRVIKEKQHRIWPIFFERLVRPWQERRLKNKKIKPENEASGVVISDRVIKVHENDRRREFKNRYEENIKKYL